MVAVDAEMTSVIVVVAKLSCVVVAVLVDVTYTVSSSVKKELWLTVVTAVKPE